MEQKKQKYFRGNLLRLKWGHEIWSAKSNYTERPKNVLSENETAYFIDIIPEWAGKEVVIKGSYGDLYGTAGNGGGYHVNFLDGSNEAAWISENQMEFIELGGEHLFQTINENKLNRKLDMCVSLVEVLATDNTDGGIAFNIKTNKPMVVGADYKGLKDLETNHYRSYCVAEEANGVYKVVPHWDTVKTCDNYFIKI
jgi:hypothetical protein